jgi:hypothetical protein
MIFFGFIDILSCHQQMGYWIGILILVWMKKILCLEWSPAPWHIISTFYLAFFDILSGIVSGSLFGMCSGPGVAGPQHPELAMWSSGPGVAGPLHHEIGTWLGGEGGRGRRRRTRIGRRGVVPLLQSRDPHLHVANRIFVTIWYISRVYILMGTKYINEDWR